MILPGGRFDVPNERLFEAPIGSELLDNDELKLTLVEAFWWTAPVRLFKVRDRGSEAPIQNIYI